MSAVGSTTSSSTTGTSSSSSTAGFGSLTTADFMQMLIAELQDQDPTQPMTSADLLNQLSTMAQLQSTDELDTALQSNTTNQQISIGASLIGMSITGTDSNGNSVSGTVTQAYLSSGTGYVGVGSSQVPLANITEVTAPG